MIDQSHRRETEPTPDVKGRTRGPIDWMTIAVWSILAISGIVMAGLIAYVARQRGLHDLLGTMFLLGPVFCFVSIGKIGQKAFHGRWRTRLVWIGVVGMLVFWSLMVWTGLQTHP